MPYTRNTRIKVVSFGSDISYTPQVEYKYPIIDKSKWVDFKHIEKTLFENLFCKKDYYKKHPHSSAYFCIGWSARKGQDEESFAKAVIEKYHEMLDDLERGEVVTYVKYPD